MHKKIDRSEIHKMLWERRDRLNKVKLHQREFAVELGVTHYTVSRLINELIDKGALKKISAGQGNIGTYAVREPN
jgi:DNA-binding MarR family transcriptional regulator